MQCLRWSTAGLVVAALHLGLVLTSAEAAEPTPAQHPYQRACAACHGHDGRGASPELLGLLTPPPDFTDCSFVTREPDADWNAISNRGGPIRAFHRHMPAYEGALPQNEIQEALDHIRGFCAETGWPRGDLNFPRPILTEKAFPEDEFVFSTAVSTQESTAVKNKLIYEQRFGKSSQFEVIVPLSILENEQGQTRAGIGDVAVGAKTALFASLQTGTILSLAFEVILPTGEADAGYGKGYFVFEPFLSFGQALPLDSFVQIQVGAEIPDDQAKGTNEMFWRAALGMTFEQSNLSRAWTPMVEFTGVHEFADEPETLWSIAPGLQVTLSQRGHIMLAVGAEFPLNETESRKPAVLAYLLWDWFDGGFFEGW